MNRFGFQKKFLSKLVSVILSSFLLLTACSVNVLTSMSTTTSDSAYYENALKYMNASSWDSSLLEFAKISSSFMANRQVRKNYAGALAGKCGLVFSTYMTSLSGATIDSSNPFFKFLMNAFTDKTVSPAHCSSAQVQMDWIATNYGSWSSDETLFVLILNMARAGSYLRNKADLDGANSKGDGTPDSTFNSCNTTTGSYLTDSEMKEIIASFSLILANFTAYSATLGGAGTALTSVQAICTSLNLTACSTTDPAAVTAGDVTNFRSLLMVPGNDATVGSLGIGEASPTGYQYATWTLLKAAHAAAPDNTYWGCTPGSTLCCN